jgi:hypothetical protein
LSKEKGCGQGGKAILEVEREVLCQTDFPTIHSSYLTEDLAFLFESIPQGLHAQPCFGPFELADGMNLDQRLSGNIQVTAKRLSASQPVGLIDHKLSWSMALTSDFATIEVGVGQWDLKPPAKDRQILLLEFVQSGEGVHSAAWKVLQDTLVALAGTLALNNGIPTVGPYGSSPNS